MTKAHHLRTRKLPTVQKNLPLNFLLGCSQIDLGNFEVARLAEIADLNRQLNALLNRYMEQLCQAALASWFKSQDRNSLKHAIENEESPLEWAARMIRTGQRSDEEQELLPLPALEPGAAHLAAAMLYQQRNIAEGKCQNCPEPLDRNSVRFCSKHLAMARNNARTKKGLTSDPGSCDYLYAGDVPESTHGRQPGTLKALAMSREQRSRGLLAEAGIPPESAAVTKRAAKQALMEWMPNSKVEAKSASELFLALLSSDSLAKKALAELFSEGKIQRIGKGTSSEPFRYFTKMI